MKLQHMVAILTAASFIVFGYALFNSSALPRYWAMQQKKNDLQARVSNFEARVLEQKSAIKLLSGDTPDSRVYLEQVARREYGFIGNQETLLILN